VCAAPKDADAKGIPGETCRVMAADGASPAVVDAHSARVVPGRGRLDMEASQAVGTPAWSR
jgi:hypothetical protein